MRDFLLLLIFTSGMANAKIITPYPETFEIKQINSAEKERIRLCQALRKYDRQPTGFYIEAGKTVEVKVEILTAADQNTMPELTVGTLGFNVGDRSIGVTTRLTAGINTITRHSGGLIWLGFLHNGDGEPKGRAKITFTANSEQVRAPHYVYGVTTDEEFTEMMQAYQTPDVIFHSDYAAIVATREAAQLYSINENKNDWMEAIHTLIDKESEISGLDNKDPNPLHHRLKAGEVRFLLAENTLPLPHAAYAGYTGYPAGKQMRYLTKIGVPNNNSWMLGHEIGHQHQQPAYLINRASESTVNIYSYVVERNIVGSNYNRTSATRWTQAQSTYLNLPIEQRVYDMLDSKLTSIIGFDYSELRFMVWEQLFLLFGDRFYKTLHRIVREEKVLESGADERRMYLIWKSSQITGYDLSEFFNQWGIRVSNESLKTKLNARIAGEIAKGTIVALPKTVEECIMVTGQNRPEWTPLPLQGITASKPESRIPLDRYKWTISASITGVTDSAVGGNEPFYMIDNDTTSAFSFVKPGKTHQGVTGQADYIPSFTIDMQSVKSFNYVAYMHRTAKNNVSFWIRARQISIYGSDNNVTFTPIREHYAVNFLKNDNEITVEFPEQSYRYIKVVIENWDKTNGSTIQVAEFNAGIMFE
ncbi:MAG: M60 family metallopeptidase [Prevotellaceae bacterium]|jgi:hypothetical protein|nr:M60 family metallopeptidase [Prevotellaceae bacterium]